MLPRSTLSRTASRLLRIRINTQSTRALGSDAHPSNESPDAQTHFGFSEIPLAAKQTKVSQIFSSVAENYDLMNDVMSLRIHRLWKRTFVADLSPTSQMRILDVAGGTGDIAKRICDTIDQRGGFEDDAGVTVCDVNEEMLAVGEKRLRGRAECILGDAQELPFDSNSFDAYTISFGMRNVPRPDIAMKEAMRVLKPGGRFMMLEFAKVENVLMKQIYDMYSFQVIPRVGSLVAGDEQAYRYLVESIRKFPGQDEVARMLQDIDFRYVSVTDYSGGIAACYSAFKPVS